MSSGHRHQRGMALLLALAVTAIISALLSGLLLLSVSHLALSHTNSAYANALNLAEAGINWELWKISHDRNAADQSPVTVEYPSGSGRFFTVHVEAYPSGGTWVPPSDLWVIGVGTVDGVSRTVRVVTRGATDFFGHYALFGMDQLDVGGSATINGATGTNGLVDTNGNPDFNGNFWYCGPANGDDVSDNVTGTVYHAPLPEYWPTVDDFASRRAEEKYGATPPQTIDYFKNHNDNSQIVNSLGEQVQIKSFAIDNHTFGDDGTIVLPPGDYYFEKINLPSNNTLRIDSATGVVNIWLGPAGGVGKADTINGSMLFTAQDVNRFHLYDGSKRTLKMNGTMDFYGHIFAYNGPDKSGQYYGSVEVNGTGSISGSVIGWEVSRTTGNATITFQSTGGGENPDPGDFWGLQSWEEVNPA